MLDIRPESGSRRLMLERNSRSQVSLQPALFKFSYLLSCVASQRFLKAMISYKSYTYNKGSVCPI